MFYSCLYFYKSFWCSSGLSIYCFYFCLIAVLGCVLASILLICYLKPLIVFSRLSSFFFISLIFFLRCTIYSFCCKILCINYSSFLWLSPCFSCFYNFSNNRIWFWSSSICLYLSFISFFKASTLSPYIYLYLYLICSFYFLKIAFFLTSFSNSRFTISFLFSCDFCYSSILGLLCILFIAVFNWSFNNLN